VLHVEEISESFRVRSTRSLNGSETLSGDSDMSCFVETDAVDEGDSDGCCDTDGSDDATADAEDASDDVAADVGDDAAAADCSD
jgi:hypothetical protein